MLLAVEAVKIVLGAFVSIIVRASGRALTHVVSLVSAFSSVGYEDSTRASLEISVRTSCKDVNSGGKFVSAFSSRGSEESTRGFDRHNF